MITTIVLVTLAIALAARLFFRPADGRPICTCGRPTWRTTSDGWPECDHCLDQRLAARSPKGKQ